MTLVAFCSSRNTLTGGAACINRLYDQPQLPPADFHLTALFMILVHFNTCLPSPC